MRKTWLIFSQAVTVSVAVLFVVATLKPDWLRRSGQRTRRDVAAKLARMGVDADEEHVFTCAMATARSMRRWAKAWVAWSSPSTAA